jgi:hypothetical protein
MPQVETCLHCSSITTAVSGMIEIEITACSQHFNYELFPAACNIIASKQASLSAGVEAGPLRVRRFIEKWTQKEALVKATGRGLAEYSTRLFSVGVCILNIRDYTCVLSLTFPPEKTAPVAFPICVLQCTWPTGHQNLKAQV